MSRWIWLLPLLCCVACGHGGNGGNGDEDYHGVCEFETPPCPRPSSPAPFDTIYELSGTWDHEVAEGWLLLGPPSNVGPDEWRWRIDQWCLRTDRERVEQTGNAEALLFTATNMLTVTVPVRTFYNPCKTMLAVITADWTLILSGPPDTLQPLSWTLSLWSDGTQYGTVHTEPAP